MSGRDHDAPVGIAVPHSSGTERPSFAVPAGACDCHMHFYSGRYPGLPGAVRGHADATVADYRLLQQRLGTSRVVVVTPSWYGTDNRPTLDGMAEIGTEARGIAVVDTSVADSALRRLSDLGIRGIRFNLATPGPGPTSADMMEPLARRVAGLGMHLQLHIKADQIVELEPLLARLAAPLVFDHMGRIPQPDGARHAAYAVIMRLVDAGRAWVKVSGAYHDTRTGPPVYADTSALARAFVAAAPERMIWGSDWPHPSCAEKPDDTTLLDLLSTWAPSEATRRHILVTNPAVLYGFDRS